MIDNEQLYSDAKWIDYIENEIEPSLKEDMALVLLNSTVDQAIYRKYHDLRQQIKNTNENSMPEDPAYYEKFKNQVMAALPSEMEETDDMRISGVRVFLNTLRLATVLPFK